MANTKKLIQAAAGAAGGAGLNVEEVFSTYLYNGDGSSSRTITNGIDLAGEGGLVWVKSRSNAYSHFLLDTERGTQKVLQSNATNAQISTSNTISAFNSDGWTMGDRAEMNQSSSQTYASWTFRKAPKFFTCLTYTGTGSAQTISHDLGAVPAVMIVKRTDASGDWIVFHRSLDVNGDNAPETDGIILQSSSSAFDNFNIWNDTAPTSTNFTVGGGSSVNASGGTHVAYLFAHNDGDGDFGPTGDQDIIKCDKYVGNGSSTNGPEIDLGFEPQWLLIKRASGIAGWRMYDNMRGIVTGGNESQLSANTSDAESSVERIELTPTGFKVASNTADTNFSGNNYIYIAIRRGPMAVPESATDVFAVDTGSTSDPAFDSGFPVDFAIMTERNTNTDNDVATRLLQGSGLRMNSTVAEVTGYSNFVFDFMDGWDTASYNTQDISWMWRRAPNFCDVVCYTGTGSAQNITHNLGATPEFYIVKRRDSTGAWYAYHKDIDKDGDGLPETDVIQFNANSAAFDNATYWNDTAPTETTFTVGTQSAVNASGGNYIAYLFTSLDGVAKVGGYTGNGTSQTINCGFAPRFVFLTKWGPVGGGNKLVWDTVRGIVAGNDPFIDLRSATAEDSSYDFIDPDSNGFVISGTSGWVNASGSGYMFYAIA